MTSRSVLTWWAGLCLLAVLLSGPAAGAATTTCWPDAAPDNTGSVNGEAPRPSEVVAWRAERSGAQQNYYHEVGYIRFNIASIPMGSAIVDVSIHYHVNDCSGHAEYRLTPLEKDPLETPDYLVARDITVGAERASWRFAAVQDSGGPGWREVNLGLVGIEQLRQSLGLGWFGVGFANKVSGVRVDGWASTNVPYLVVESRMGRLDIHVDDDAPHDPGPGDPSVSDPDEDGTAAHPFDSIQEAIDFAAWVDTREPDRVLVADGVYTGDGNRDITFNGKAVHVLSANGPEYCTIDCQGSAADPHRAFLFQGEGAATTVAGFTIRGGYQAGGGAILGSAESSPVIRGNVFFDNHAVNGGGAIHFRGGAVIGNVIHGNSADTGGGIYTDSWSRGCISNNTIYGNSATTSGGGIHNRSGLITLVNNVVFGNVAAVGGGLYTWGNPHIITNCTVTANTATDSGGGLYIIHDSILTNCIVRDNGAPTGDEIYFLRDDHEVRYSNINNDLGDVYVHPDATVDWGAGVIDDDPAFVTGDRGDYYLSQLAAGQPMNSSCIDSGNSVAALVPIPIAYDMTTGVTTWLALADLTTAVNFERDAGVVDIGFHYPLSTTMAGRLSMAPRAGVLPFSTLVSIKLDNHYTGLGRRLAARLDVTLGDGSNYPNWRAGWAHIDAGSSYTTSWIQNLPDFPALKGNSLFTLHAWDVTPAPYNQPPYPPSGDSDSDTVTVVGMAP